MTHITITESDDITAAMSDARCYVALAKLSQFAEETIRLGGMAQRNLHRKQQVVDCLYDIASANRLASIHDGDRPTVARDHAEAALARLVLERGRP
ncbi:MAG TPA: hypothetical protein VJV58_04810 [Bradyrhizobium sp.]|uniref:hypothetical protein n=1 Tax=Bradyrhizobium sp. TaxID=376 RepID=UPI002B45F421|nr:hypothetical protein [Bradyrhizobium sp.]HKO70233.1 hypothetical protein [Bradyrhizobium sp.]